MNNATADPCQFIMPSGKYEGRPISTIEPGYLRWLVSESAAEPAVRKAAEQELMRRTGDNPLTAPPARRDPHRGQPDPAPSAKRIMNPLPQAANPDTQQPLTTT